ncbi:YHYH domain-containing protein [Bacillus weihaiensis]|uniref:YHYH domain-containing protein n=1 Tax=Bacillus weihaiensis TaxID=1547283 RepID=A0A1L3MW17_9BACI|nr:YHYH domain-containing protein [Bacillus weihaiensis]APH06524.1 hypothetical protein A9C19_18320 [Bacillus weihaiensis]
MIQKVAVITIVFSILFGSSVYAHSGRTDGSGGHNCSEKSQVKGLCTGYHYHNGGGETTSGSSETSSPESTSASTDKDCSDFASYEEVIEYWNEKGYSKTNDPERLDGWGNTVDDGIPCEAPNGYDTSKINGSDAQLAKIQAEKDLVNGERDGYTAGLNDGSNGKEENPTSNGTEAYVDAFRTSYQEGYESGIKKFESEKTMAIEAGKELGTKQDILEVPKEYQKNDQLSNAFEEGFNKGVAVRDDAKKKEYEEKGYKEGFEDKISDVKDIKDIYRTAYQVGYEKGQTELMDKYKQEGYHAAFTLLEYQAPDYSNEKYIGWYKEGFNSNNEVEEIKKAGYELGYGGEKYTIPDAYLKSEVIYKQYYEEGYKEYEIEKKEDRATTAGGVGIVVLGWLARRFYVAKKMVG